MRDTVRSLELGGGGGKVGREWLWPWQQLMQDELELLRMQ
jgi:hypothetical protein